MKLIMKLTLTLLILFSQSQFSRAGDQDDSSIWLYNIDQAKAEAVKENKLILISFSGSDWCAPCIRLEKNLFATDQFADFAKNNLILLKLDFPAQKKNKLPEEQLHHNEALADQYNKKGAFPLVLLIDAEGEVKGYMEHPKSTTEDYISSINTIVTKK